MVALSASDALAVASVAAIHSGDAGSLTALLGERPELATARIVDDKGGIGRTLMHVVTDWPGYYPNGPKIVELLLAAGADPDADTGGGRPETPLHWAASSDDMEVAEALIDGGAAVDIPGGSIGTPLENAVGYGCWHVARLLYARGARADKLWVAAGLGVLPLVREHVEQTPPPSRNDIDHAFWQACHGGQLRVAAYLLEHGADIDATPDHNTARPIVIAGMADTRRELLVDWLKQRGMAL